VDAVWTVIGVSCGQVDDGRHRIRRPITGATASIFASPNCRPVTYEKGTWIVHMLRRRWAISGHGLSPRSLDRYHFTPSAPTFRELAGIHTAEVSGPGPEDFFENWVYGTGIPS